MIAEHISLEGFKIHELRVEEREVSYLSEIPLRLVMVVGDGRVKVRRDFTVPSTSASSAEVTANLVFGEVLDFVRHELVEKFRFKGRPIEDPHPEEEGYCESPPWNP